MTAVDWTNASVPDPKPAGHRQTTALVLSKSLPPSRDTTQGDRQAILDSLYAQLHALNQDRRAGTLTAHGRASLNDVKAEIDRWELEQRRALGPSEVVTRLEALTERVLRLASSGT